MVESGQNVRLIVIGQMNIVKMNGNSRPEPWKDFKDEEVNVARRLHGVGAIDEQEVRWP